MRSQGFSQSPRHDPQAQTVVAASPPAMPRRDHRQPRLLKVAASCPSLRGPLRQVASEVHGHDTIRVANAQQGLADGGQGHHHPLRNAEPSSMWYSRVLGALSRRTSRDPWPLLPVLSVFLLASRTGRFEGWFATFSLIEARSHPPFVRRSNFSVLSSTAMTLVALSLIATIGALRQPSEIPAHLLYRFGPIQLTASYQSGPEPAAAPRWTCIQRGRGFRRKLEPRRPDHLHVRSEHMYDA